jgi:hypothetical protein|tara:strand:+ start:591 stop:941 length:351 start_codon:yes stop_codon:yes gene_type:complete
MEDIIVDGTGSSIGISVEETEIDIEISVTSLSIDAVAKLTDLTDINSSNLSDSTNAFVLAYNATTEKFEFINPDEVVDNAAGVVAGAPGPGGFSQEAIDYLDETLDNKIDVDGGEF